MDAQVTGQDLQKQLAAQEAELHRVRNELTRASQERLANFVLVPALAYLITVVIPLAASMLVAAQNFTNDPNVLVMVMLIGILVLILLMSLAGEMGKRVRAKSDLAQAQAADAGL